MARYTGPKLKLARREGCDLNLKSARRSFASKVSKGTDTITKPGQHGKISGARQSDFGNQLREKQKMKRIYGVLERQFRRYYAEAERMKGNTGELLIALLESRLDNVVYRAGLASSRKEARQLVRHGHYTLNGHKANIPSILLKAGDVVAVADKSRQNEKLKAVVEANSAHPVPSWIDFDAEKLTAKINQLPNREDIDLDVEEHLIVELYSK